MAFASGSVEVLVLGGAITAHGGPVQHVTDLTGAGTTSGGPVQHVTDQALDQVGNIEGRSEQPHTEQAGIAILIDGGAAMGNYQRTNYQQSDIADCPVECVSVSVVDDAGGDRVNVGLAPTIVVELARITHDFVGGASPQVVFTLPGGFSGALLEQVIVRPTTVTALVAPPSISLRALVAGDLVSTFVVASDAGEFERRPSNVNSQLITSTASVAIDAVANAAAFTAQLILLGRLI